MSLALVYGSPIAVSADMGQNWKILNNKSGHVDWCSVDWTDPDTKFILALKHESGGTLIVSRDGGATFDVIGKDFGPAWIFDGQTAVASEAKSKTKPARPGAHHRWRQDVRTGGRLFRQGPAALFPGRASKALRWHALLAHRRRLDLQRRQGQDLEKGLPSQERTLRPSLRQDGQHMFLLTTAGIIESTDAGATWTKPLALPKEMKAINFMTWLDYDPLNDVLYTTRMSADLYKLERKK